MHDIMVSAYVEAKCVDGLPLRLHYFEETKGIKEVTPPGASPGRAGGMGSPDFWAHVAGTFVTYGSGRDQQRPRRT
eukprot:7673906-Heterocapsa_arctica.AAC.1